MSVAYSTFGLGGFGTGQSCGGARSVHFDDLTQRCSAADPLYTIANALPDYDTFRGDPSLFQATRDCFNENIDSLFDTNTGGQGKRTYGSRPELRQVREAIESTAGYFKETVDQASDPQKARHVMIEIVETLLSRVGAEECTVPSAIAPQDYPEEACNGQYTEYDPWAQTPPATSTFRTLDLAPTTKIDDSPSRSIPNDQYSFSHCDTKTVNTIPSPLSPSLSFEGYSTSESASSQHSTRLRDTPKPKSSFYTLFSRTPSWSLSWVASRDDIFADEDGSACLARSTEFETNSGSDGFSPRTHAALFSSQLSSTSDSLDKTSGGATLSDASSSW